MDDLSLLFSLNDKKSIQKTCNNVTPPREGNHDQTGNAKHEKNNEHLVTSFSPRKPTDNLIIEAISF